MAEPLNEFEHPLQDQLQQPPSVFYSNEQSQPPQMDISHVQAGSTIIEVSKDDSLPIEQSYLQQDTESGQLVSRQLRQAARSRQTPSLTSSNQNLLALNRYLKRNLTAMQSIVQHEFGADVGSGYTVHRRNLYELLIHLLSVEAIELLSADGQNILYSEEYGEASLKQWFIEYCRSSHNEFHIKEDDELVSLNQLLQFLRYIVEVQRLIVRDNSTKGTTKYSNAALNSRDRVYTEQAEGLPNVREELIKTKQRYEQLLETRTLSESEKKSLVAMLNSVKQQLAELNSTKLHQQPSRSRSRKPFQPEMTIRSCIEIIFEYYCKQSYTAGRNPTFDRILHENNVLSMSKFMLFCRDFGLVKNTEFLKGQGESELELRPAQIIEIFKKNSTNYKEMSYEQFQTALQRIAGSIFKDSDALTKMYEHLGIKDEASFRNKLKLLRIPFSYKQVKKSNTPISNYKFKFFAHGGKLAEGVKETVVERIRSKDRDDSRGITANNDMNRITSNRPIKFRSITEQVDEIKRVDSREDSLRLKQSPAYIPRTRKTNRRVPTDRESKADLSKNTTQQEIILNSNYIRLVDSDLNAIPTNNHSSYQTSNANITGYSNVYRQKMSQKKSGSKWNYKLNQVVSEARDIVGSTEKDDFAERKGYLESLIEDDGEDDYLKKHYQLQEQHSNSNLKSRVNRRIDQFYQAQLEKEKFIEGLSKGDSRTIPSSIRPIKKKLTYI